ncbi:inositol hexakisphosphate and diphosphoinositol-pentakisphosphate kinase isoform X3 [Anopheles merus]|uniref:inositol hexakisphosphate and diphosphoinositol-pentakisphosphate kinase isoform X3 n=1 Tax=Anopheles merus TaxID=30066 RepID=UPI001BE43BAF|nr:inositol hexakisphosphate and diphosphoinositol-pentakisphosphate kinase isoform X3 [Anopheles merus]
MEWSWLRDWWRLAKFRRGDRTDPTTAGQRDRRRASGSGAAVSGFTGSALPDIADTMQELEPVRFFVDRLDDSCDDASDDYDEAQRPAVDGEEGEQERRHHYHHPDRHLYFGATDAFYDDPYCDCEKCLNGDLDPTDGLDSDDSSTSGKQVVVAVCAMSKKSQSKPMKEILTRLQEFEYIRMVVIGEEIILNEPVDRWPLCDCLISFHSKGFPLEKAIQYAQLRQPYVINNLHMQFDIQEDRRRVYAILQQEGIEIPRYAVLDRDSPDPKQHELVESEDHVEVNGIVFNKPFVEKPVSAEDHNIYIYYPTSAGGGSQRLFRKIGSRSSVYSPESRVRKTGSFIYEDFMPTDGTDVKVYTVGPDYAHAEARKSPALDGKVERDSDGKEIRYPVILSNAEKLISRKVCLAFKQTVCGFDLLRANGKSFVCDVNGFSFVKNSNKYYDDCAKILGNMILRELAPQLHIPWSVPFQLDDPPIVPTTFGKMMELRCVTAVIRHGDRTPKQKMKVEVRHQKFFEIFEKYDGYRYGHIKLKRPKQLQEILDIARSLLAEIQTKAADSEIEEKQSKLEQLKSVLEMYGHFSGINRKVQMKYQPKGRPRGSSSDDGKQDCSTFVFVSDAPKEPSLVLILKWGGELTPAGRIQAEELGRIFRCMYPGGQSRQPGVGEGPGAQGLGLLRLHSTFRHDLKIYASDEGRVQMTAAAFAKGLLALEGELTPILVQMVKSANTNGLLDNDCDSSKYQNMAKSRLHELMQIDREFTAEDRAAINPGNAISINLAMNFVKNPVQCCAQVHSLIRSLMAVVAVKRDDPKTRDAVLYHGETWELMGRRWGKIEKDFCTKNKNYDISKIPDIYDCIKYDLQHNQHTLQFDLAEELYISAKYLADIVIPQEYGLTMHEKLTIGQGICTPLLKKIRADLQRNIEELGGEESVNRLNPRYSHGVSSPGRHVRTRLYFTSESHVHSLLTVLRHGGLLNVLTDEQWRRAMDYVSMVSELNYMSQIVIMLYEDPMKDPSSEERFHVELHFSPGVNCCVQKNLPPGPGFRPHSRNDSVTSKNASGDEDTTSRIDEENDTEEESSFSNNSSLHHTPSKTLSRTDADFGNIVASAGSANVKERRVKKMKSSSPIPIGSCHTVSGHEAMDLAKRLSEELAVQQQHQLQQQQHQLQQQQHPYHHHHHQQQQKHLHQQHHHHLTGSFGCGGNAKDITRPLSPDSEPRARSFEHQQQHHHHGHQHHHHHGKMHHHRSKGGKGALTMNTLRAAAERCQYAKMESAKDLLEATDLALDFVLNDEERCVGCECSALQAQACFAPALPTCSSLSALPTGREEERAAATGADSDVPDVHAEPPPASAVRPSLYIGPPESSYSCDSISEFTPNLDDQELYVSSFSESEDEQQREDADDAASGSDQSRYYSALGQHDDCSGTYLRRSLSYTFSNDPGRYHPGGTVDEQAAKHRARRTLMARSADELSAADRQGHGNYGTSAAGCCCPACWVTVPADDSIHRRSRSLSPPCVRRLRSNTTAGVSPALLQVPPATDDGPTSVRLVRYPVRAMARFASDPSLPLGRGWAEAAHAPSDRAKALRSLTGATWPWADQWNQPVLVTLTTPPPDEDEDGEQPLLRLLQAAADGDGGAVSGAQQHHPSGTGNDGNNGHVASANSSSPPLTHISSPSSGRGVLHPEPTTILSKVAPIVTSPSFPPTGVLSSFSVSITSSTSTTNANNNNTTICLSADTSNIFSTCSSHVHTTTNTADTTPAVTATSALIGPLLSATNRNPTLSSARSPTTKPVLVKSYTIDGCGSSSGDGLLGYPMTTTTASVADESAAAAAGPTDGGADTGLATSTSTLAGGGGGCPPCCCGTGGNARYPGSSHGSDSLSSCCCCCCCCCSTPSSSAGGLAGAGTGAGPAGSGGTGSSAATVRRQRHSIAGQMSYFKMLGTFSKKMATSTNSLFSTAVISGSSSAPNLRDMIPSTASPSGFGGVPPIRPLETLHNALSLKQLDAFLERMTIGPLFKTPASSPPPKHPLISGGPIAHKGSLSVVSHDSIGEGIASGSGSMQPPSSIVAATTLGSSTKTAEERTAASRAGTRNAGAVVGSTTVAAGMPGPNGNSTPANGGAQQSWSDHSSSMTSSISALSSGGPSSPNYSEVYSRGCPSSDMSASITSSTDGLAAIASGPGEQLVALPHLFSASAQISSPKHPGSVELNKGGEDAEAPRHLDEPPGATGLLHDEGTRRRGSAMDVSTGDLTPVSACSDWGDSNTNDATKGSITNYDLTTANTTEEEDEDATISTDTCLSVGEQQHHQQCCLMPCTGMDAPFASSSSIKEGPGMVSVNSSAVGKKVSPFRGALPFDEPLHPAGGGSDPHDLDTSKPENRVVRGFRIQRQISLYENQKEEGKSVSQQQAHDWCGGGGSKAELSATGRQQQQQPLSRLHMSFDELTHSDRNTTPAGRLAQPAVASSAAATAAPPPIPHTPGALVIREGFIEPPRLTRVTKSFHGKTNHQRFGVEEQQHGSESTPDGGYRRASDGPVATTGTARYSKTTLRPQHSSAAGVSSRFTTSIVQEPEQLRATEPDTEPSAASSKTK